MTRRTDSEPVRSSSMSALSLVAIVLALFTGARTEPTSLLHPVQSLPPDVAATTAAAWDRFSTAFPARLDCMGEVELELVRALDGGDARYRPQERRIQIEIPTSPARFPESLIHELGHHLETACVDDRLRRAFLEAQGMDLGASWWNAEQWHEIPAEHFAEAVVAVVNGKRLLHHDIIPLTPETIDLIRAWGTASS